MEILRSDAAAGGAVSADAAWVLVWADDPEAAWGRIVRARTEEHLEESRLLAGAFRPASVETVLAPFDGRTLTWQGRSYRVFSRGGLLVRHSLRWNSPLVGDVGL